MKPLISYYGGKQRIASQILPHIEAIPHTVYCEPYCGGAALLFAKPKRHVSNGDHYREVINDLDDRLITMYRVAKLYPEEFERQIQATLYSQSDHRRSVEILRNPSQYSELDRAWAYYVNIQQSFSNVLFGGWGTSVYGRNQANTWANKKKELYEQIERLSQAHVACEPALICIDRWDSSQTCFFVDCPYPGTDQGHYLGFTMDDWQELCNKLDSIQGSYVLSNYPQPIEPKSAQQRIEINAICSGSAKGRTGRRNNRSTIPTDEELGDRQRTEVLWICDRSANMRKDLKPIAYRGTQLSLIDAI